MSKIDVVLRMGERDRYRLLDRMRLDCIYFLGYGMRNPKDLWGVTPEDHIAYMKALWNSFSAKKKPEWLTAEEINRFEKQMLMAIKVGVTKERLRRHLEEGNCMDELLMFSCGQECTIFKADDIVFDDTIVYIPDVELNDIPIDRSVDCAEIDFLLSYCYTGNDFLRECDGDAILARQLFDYCDWQHPSSALPELID